MKKLNTNLVFHGLPVFLEVPDDFVSEQAILRAFHAHLDRVENVFLKKEIVSGTFPRLAEDSR
jgi:hypothetical protein